MAVAHYWTRGLTFLVMAVKTEVAGNNLTVIVAEIFHPTDSLLDFLAFGKRVIAQDVNLGHQDIKWFILAR